MLYLHGSRWFWQLLYSDDYLWYVSGDTPFHDLILSIVFLHSMGFPFAWHKFKGGFEVAWIGFWADLTTWQVGLSAQRADWVIRWLEDLMQAQEVSPRRVAEGLGRLGFAVTAVDFYKPFLGPWYSWVAACRKLPVCDVPLGLEGNL